MPKKKNFNTSAILKEVYPLVESVMNKNTAKWKQCMSRFIQKRSTLLFDTVPCDRIYYSKEDGNDLVKSINVSLPDVVSGIKHTYYWDINPFKPSQAKDGITIISLCIVRYFLLKKDKKNLDLSLIYQSFTGKYYPSIHYGSFPTVSPSKYRYVMEYVVNNMLTNKYDLKTKGNVIGAIDSINQTWITSYEKMIKSFDDEDVTYVIQQLHNRIKSFMRNIASLYYEAYNNKEYVSYEKDSIPEDGESASYHLSNNDAFRLGKYVENAMNRLNTTQVDYRLCKIASDANVKTEEIRSILEVILKNKKNIDKVRELITLLVATFMQDNKGKSVASVAFYKHCTQAKPNTKDPSLNRIKEIVDEFLDDNSIAYRKRKKRIATKLSYQRAFLTYFAMIIIESNK